MGVVFFIYNAAFALILLLMVLASSITALTSKNPDTRYQPMRDDRGSFIKSQTQLNTELDALGATARGEGKGPRSRLDDDDDSGSFSSGSNQYNNDKTAGINQPGFGQQQTAYQGAARSPDEATSQPFLQGQPPVYRSNNSSPAPYGYQNSRPGSMGSQRTGHNAPAGPNMWNRGVGFEHGH